MKKLFISLLSIVLLGFASVASAYTVVSGDTMWGIAQKEKISLSELIKNNPHIKNPNFIVPGDHLNTGKMWIPELYPTNEDLLGAVTSPIAGVTYSLAGSGITSSATSITLTSLTIPQTGYELVDSDFSDTFYITLEPGNTKKQEIASCTTVVQNANNTATLSGCSRGLTPFTPFTASTTYAFAHGGGTTVIFSDPPQLFNEFTAKGNQEVIGSPWRFDQYPTASTTLGNATTSRQFITLGQANLIGNQGAATSTETVAGIAELATQIEMASGTYRGVNDPLVLQAKYATSTCQTVGLYTVITENDGKIAKNCVDQTESYSWTGLNTFTATTTFTTTTMASTTATALNVTTINNKPASDLLTSSTTPALEYHFHPAIQTSGAASRAVNLTGFQQIFHNLGVVPSYITFNGYAETNNAGTVNYAYSNGSYTSTTIATAQSNAHFVLESVGTNNSFAGTDTTNVLMFKDLSTNTDASAVVVAPTSTTFFYLNWTTNVNDGDTRVFTWTAFK